MHRAEELEMEASIQGSRLENKMGIICEKLSELKWEHVVEKGSPYYTCQNFQCQKRQRVEMSQSKAKER